MCCLLSCPKYRGTSFDAFYVEALLCSGPQSRRFYCHGLLLNYCNFFCLAKWTRHTKQCAQLYYFSDNFFINYHFLFLYSVADWPSHRTKPNHFNWTQSQSFQFVANCLTNSYSFVVLAIFFLYSSSHISPSVLSIAKSFDSHGIFIICITSILSHYFAGFLFVCLFVFFFVIAHEYFRRMNEMKKMSPAHAIPDSVIVLAQWIVGIVWTVEQIDRIESNPIEWSMNNEIYFDKFQWLIAHRLQNRIWHPKSRRMRKIFFSLIFPMQVKQ